jgi:glycosyltransferase involved in cell wall biosynthesis
MERQARVLLLIPHLGGGGAEQVMALLARGLSAQKYELHLAVLTGSDTAGVSLPPNVTVHLLGAPRVRSAAFRLLRLIRRLRPGVVLAGMAHAGFLVLLLKPLLPRSTRLLIRQNGTASAAIASGQVPRYTRLLYRWLYPRADCVICQSSAMARDLLGFIRIAPERVIVLPNPIDLEAIAAAAAAPSSWTGPGPHLLAVGRLAEEKGFDLLLEAFKTVRERHPQADLLIAGEGPLRDRLQVLARDLGLAATVRFAGYVDRPQLLFPGATLFVLSSRHEGMPNALLEASAAGLPLAATPASGGVVDLVGRMPGAWLAADLAAGSLASTLLTALAAIEPGQRFVRPVFNP